MATQAEITPSPGRRGHLARWLALVAAAAVAVGVGGGLLVHKLTARSITATRTSGIAVVRTRNGLFGEASWPAGKKPAPPIHTLRDQNGQPFSLSSLHGRTVAMVFFDSHCKQECPLEGRALARAEASMPAAQRPVLVAVSVNPADTHRSVAQAIREWGLAKEGTWYWLMGTKAKLAPIWSEYHIQVSPPIDGDIQHTEALYLIDKGGYMRSVYLWPFADTFVTKDLRHLAAETSRE